MFILSHIMIEISLQIQNRKNKQKMHLNKLNEQHEELLDTFSTFLNDSVSIINQLKKSIYDILNIPIKQTDVFIEPNIISVSSNCKRTLDDLKRISSILKGYALSKNVQRQDQQLKKSRADSILKSSRSRNSQNSNQSDSRFKKQNQLRNQQTEQFKLLTVERFKIGQDRNSRKSSLANSQLTSIRSQKILSTTQDLNSNMIKNSQKIKQNASYNLSYIKSVQQLQMNQSRLNQRVYQSHNKSTSSIISKTQQKFKQCMTQNQSGINDIIRRNTECLDVIKSMYQSLKKRKQMKKYKQSKNTQQPIKKVKKIIGYNGTKLNRTTQDPPIQDRNIRTKPKYVGTS